MAGGYGDSSIMKGVSSTKSRDENINFEAARRAASKFKGESPGDLPIPGGYTLPKNGTAADDYKGKPKKVSGGGICDADFWKKVSNGFSDTIDLW